MSAIYRIPWAIVLLTTVGCDAVDAELRRNPSPAEATSSTDAPPTTVDWPAFGARIATASAPKQGWQLVGRPTARRSSGRPKSASATAASPSPTAEPTRSATATATKRSTASTPRRAASFGSTRMRADLVDNLHLGGPGAHADGRRRRGLHGEQGRTSALLRRGDRQAFAGWSTCRRTSACRRPSGASRRRRLCYGDLLILDVGGLVAFDKMTGKLVWRVEHVSGRLRFAGVL